MYLEDMQLAMSRIAEYVHGYDYKRFKNDYKTVDAVIRNFEIIWDVAINHLPANKLQIDSILAKEK